MLRMTFGFCFKRRTDDNCVAPFLTQQNVGILIILLSSLIHSSYPSENFTDRNVIYINEIQTSPINNWNISNNFYPKASGNVTSEKQSESVATTWSAEKVTLKRKPDEFYININECLFNKSIRFSSSRGVIYGKSGGNNTDRSVTDCLWSVEVPNGYLVSSYVLFLFDPCLVGVTVTVIN